MELKKYSKTVRVGGKDLTFETGQIARQANGAVLVRCEDTMVFATACATSEPKPDIDFLPLGVFYQEKFFSAGKTLGGYIKREGRPSEKETLVSRLIDRPLRPLFPKGYYHDVQVTSTVWSSDGQNSPDVLGLCAASAALVVSDIPMAKPVGGVRVGHVDGKFVVNPSPQQMETSRMDLILAGTADAILMIEGFCDFMTEDEVIEAIETGHVEIRKICGALTEMQQEIGLEKNTSTIVLPPEELVNDMENSFGERVNQAIRIVEKAARQEALDQIAAEVTEKYTPENGEEAPYKPLHVKGVYKNLTASHMRNIALSEGIRADGRKHNEVRPIVINQSMLPRAHGSSLFTRGETQTMAVCTLGSEGMAQRYETMEGEGSRRFYLQYFFPPYSVGETGRMGPAGRREVGHGKLAERALAVAMPDKAEFPYVVRLESNITESNGSSSMASVCGGCLAMMDAGVPVKRPVSGVAMGLILEKDKHMVLTDILGVEDALGDMDFKITGDNEGITAFQMDIKVEGITPEIMREALEQARDGRVHILQKMIEACPRPRQELSRYAPRIEMIQINPSKINVVIGPGGKQIRAIIEETGVEINIEDDGSIQLSSSSADGIGRAKEIIEGLTAEVEIGRTYTGKVTSVVPFGVFVEVLPSKEGLCHISELDEKRIEDINEFIKQGEQITVKVIDINERGQLKLSRKAVLKAST